LRIKLWGTRGSVATPVASNARHGGNTPCVEVRAADGEILILDAGLGLHWLGDDLMDAGFSGGGGHAHILVSHTHWGHIQGIPFFLPMLVEGNRFSIYGPGQTDRPLSQLLIEQMDSTFCPVPNFFDDRVGAKLDIFDLGNTGGEFEIGSTHVTSRPVNHVPDVPCLGYRLESEDGSLAYIPDVEYANESQRQTSLELANGVDVLIHDAHFASTDPTQATAGCGHSSDRDALDIGRSAGAGRVLLFHHHPDRDDAGIDQVVAAHQGESLIIEAAREGAEYNLNGAVGSV
jgi:phosphoribosyl 1,2-cyclic phosphodiesterase